MSRLRFLAPLLGGVLPCAAQAVPAYLDLDLSAAASLCSSASIGPSDRNLTFQALSDFSIGSAGLFLDPLTTTPFTLELRIYDMTPGVRDGLIASGSATFADGGPGFLDVQANATFSAGDWYNIAFSTADGFGFNKYNLDFYAFDASYHAPVDIGGLFRVLDGGAGAPGGEKGQLNTVTPRLRVSVGATADVAALPVPAAGLLLLPAAALLAAPGLRRRRAGGRDAAST